MINAISLSVKPTFTRYKNIDIKYYENGYIDLYEIIGLCSDIYNLKDFKTVYPDIKVERMGKNGKMIISFENTISVLRNILSDGHHDILSHANILANFIKGNSEDTILNYAKDSDFQINFVQDMYEYNLSNFFSPIEFNIQKLNTVKKELKNAGLTDVYNDVLSLIKGRNEAVHSFKRTSHASDNDFNEL